MRLRPPQFGGAKHAHDHDNGLDIAKTLFEVHGIDAQGKSSHPTSVEAPLCPGVLPEAATVPGGDRGLCLSHHRSRELKALRHTVRTNVARAPPTR